MIGRNVKKGNLGLWIIGQIVALFIGGLVSREYGLTIGIAVFFTICVLVDIRGQIGR